MPQAKKGQKIIIHANSDQRRAGATILISDKIDLNQKHQQQRKSLHNNERVN